MGGLLQPGVCAHHPDRDAVPSEASPGREGLCRVSWIGTFCPPAPQSIPLRAGGSVQGAGRRARVPSAADEKSKCRRWPLRRQPRAAEAGRAILITSRFVWEVRALGCCSMSVL